MVFSDFQQMSISEEPVSICLFRRRYDINEISQMQGDKNWILPKEINAMRLLLAGNLEKPLTYVTSKGPNGGSVLAFGLGRIRFYLQVH
jgi:hypothetical protein